MRPSIVNCTARHKNCLATDCHEFSRIARILRAPYLTPQGSDFTPQRHLSEGLLLRSRADFRGSTW